MKAASVLLMGAGGLGPPAALYLAAAGVGRLGIVDADAVDISTLQRQVLHGPRDVGLPKTQSAYDRLRDLNPLIDVEPIQVRLSSANALEIIRRFDLVLDGSDNFPTRYLVNDACVLLGKTNVQGSVSRFDGQLSVLSAPDGPCYRCLFPEPPPPELAPNCAEADAFGVLPGMIGAMQATAGINMIVRLRETVIA